MSDVFVGLRRAVLVASVIAVALVTIQQPVLAHYFSGRYADSAIHTYCSSENTQADYDRLQPFVSASMVHLDAATVMSDSAVSCSTSTDFYWYATPPSSFSKPTTLGDATCVNTLSNNECDRARVRFNEDKLNRTDQQVRHTVCHEISHTLGSDDGHTATSGCFPQSSFSDGIYHTTHEKNHINAYYG